MKWLLSLFRRKRTYNDYVQHAAKRGLGEWYKHNSTRRTL